MDAGIKVCDTCMDTYNSFKMNHNLKFIVFKLSDDKT